MSLLSFAGEVSLWLSLPLVDKSLQGPCQSEVGKAEVGQLGSLEPQPCEDDLGPKRDRPEFISYIWTRHVTSYFTFLICKKMDVIVTPLQRTG